MATLPPIHPSITKQTQHNEMKDTVMKMKHNLLTKISLCLGLAVALAFASGCSTTSSGGGMQPMTSGEHQQMSK
jgi:sorbitol-specific phosphotransferase system component IIBC